MKSPPSVPPIGGGMKFPKTKSGGSNILYTWDMLIQVTLLTHLQRLLSMLFQRSSIKDKSDQYLFIYCFNNSSKKETKKEFQLPRRRWRSEQQQQQQQPQQKMI